MLKQKLLKRKPNSQNRVEAVESNDHVSPYFVPKTSKSNSSAPPKQLAIPLWQQFYAIECRLNHELAALTFTSPTSSLVAAVYNPVEYAHRMHCQYLERFLRNRPSVLFVGMNPGPWGMCQTGVPFGSVPIVRDWMKLSAVVDRPPVEIAVRPVRGLDCLREEISGKRFWEVMRGLYDDNLDAFAQHNFVHNFCPLAFFAASGRNITPVDLKDTDGSELRRLCTEAFLEVIELLAPTRIVSVGRFVENRVRTTLRSRPNTIVQLCLPHPSPRSLNNTNWSATATHFLRTHDICN